MTDSSDDTWYWGNELVACFNELKLELVTRSPAIIDREIIPHFNGSPDEIILCLICKKKAEVAALEKQVTEFRGIFATAMVRHEFPQSAIETLQLSFTSQEQIEEGGGRFAYFR